MISEKAYTIGIKVMMQGDWKMALGALSQSLTGVNTQVLDLTGKFEKLKGVIGGAAAAWAGEKMLSNITSLVEKTADLSHELTQIAKLGGDQSGVSQAAINVTRSVLGVTETQALSVYREIYSLVGKEHGLQLLPDLNRFNVVMSNTKNFGDQAANARNLVRAAEQMGRLNDASGNVDLPKFEHFADMAARIGTATGGMIDPLALAQIAKQGGPALMNADDATLGITAILAQYMGGPRAGTAMMSMMQQMAGGTMFTRNAAELEKLGLLGPKGKLDDQGNVPAGAEWGTDHGRVVLSQVAKDRLAKEFSNPLQALKTLPPALTSHGFNTPEQQVQELFSILMRQTTQREMADVLRNAPQMMNELGRMAGGMGVNQAYDAANNKDVEQNLKNLSAAYQNFWYAVAGPNSENEVAVIRSLTDAMRDMSSVAQKTNPTVIKLAGEAITAFGTGLLVFGGAAMITVIAGLGAVPAAIAGVVAALGLLVSFNWDSIKSAVQGLADFLTSITNKIRGLIGLSPITSDGMRPGLYTGPGAGFGFHPGAVAKSTQDNTTATDKNTNKIEEMTHALQGLINFTGPGFGGGGGGLINASYETGDVGSSVGSYVRSGSFGGASVNDSASPTTRAGKFGLPRFTTAGVKAALQGGAAANDSAAAPTGSTAGIPNWYIGKLKGFEGYTSHAMWDYHQYSIGYGTKATGPHEVIDRAEAERRLAHEASKAAAAVDAINPHLDPGTRAALTDLAYNAGPGRLRALSGMIKNNDLAGLRRVLPHYITTAGGHVLGALVRRRHDEASWIGHMGSADDSTPSGAIPHPSHQPPIDLHANLHVDGRVVAKSTLRHINKMGQGPAHGARLPDYGATRPIAI